MTLQVLESIIGGRIVQVIHQSLDGCSVWLGTTQLLNGQANVLVGAGATADMAGSAGRDKQTLAANHLLLGQGGGLALLVHLKFEMAMDATRNNQVNTAPIPSITPLCQPDSIVEIAACVKHKIKKYYETSRTLARPLFLEKLCISNQSFKGSPKNECKPRRLYHWRKSNATA